MNPFIQRRTLLRAALATAAIADRFSGIFFEPRHVRDRLGIPVFGTMKW